MEDQKFELLKELLEAKIDPIQEDVSELKADVKELKQFKWKVTGIVVAAGSGTGLVGFSISKFLDKIF